MFYFPSPESCFSENKHPAGKSFGNHCRASPLKLRAQLISVAGDHFCGDKLNIEWHSFPLNVQLPLEEWPTSGTLAPLSALERGAHLPFSCLRDPFDSDTSQSCFLRILLQSQSLRSSKSICLGFMP